MVTPDTNVIVRLLTQDDVSQYQRAYATFQNEQILILDSVLMETEWVLRFAYEFNRDQIVTALRLLSGLPNVELNDPGAIAKAVSWHAHGMDFADALHVAKATKSDRFVTFDRNLITASASMTSVQVTEP